MKKIILYNPAITSINIGDEIIAEECKNNLFKLFSGDMFIEISTHLPLSNNYLKRIQDKQFSFVLGSNLLMPKMDARFRQWDIKIWNKKYIRPVILMGVGWHHYSNKTTAYTKRLYNQIFSKKYFHSVRDEYTKNKLKEIGIENVINTGCPTFWSLDKEHCEKIPKEKSDKVIFTLTDYKKDFEKDKNLIKILKKNYKEIYFWPQGYGDYDYLKKIDNTQNIKLVNPSLSEFNKVLMQDIDYIGTRLHGGIRALKYKCRTIILAVDNRAIELNKDYNIPVINRNDINNLDEKINSSFGINIQLPVDNINKWKNQFKIK